MMNVNIFSVLLVIILPYESKSFDEVDDDLVTTHLPFRHELDEVAADFREKLRKELSVLEMEMYEEFLRLLREIDTGRDHIAVELTEELTKKVAEVLNKFEKVMAYSAERTQVLNDKMKELFSTLAVWAEGGHQPKVHPKPKKTIKRRRKVRRDNMDRSKRHTGFTVSEDELFIKDTSAMKKLLEFDPEDFPIIEGMDDMDSFLEEALDLDGDQEIKDSDFVLREFVHGTKSKYILKSTPQHGKQPPSALKRVQPRNCYDLLKEGNTQNGIYFIYPSGNGVGTEVWCDQESDGGGWTTIINRRVNSEPAVNFTMTSDSYDGGFGSPSSNHWIGLEAMHLLTQGRSHMLRILLQDADGNNTFATYGTFRIGSKVENYTLLVEGYDDRSTANDAFSSHSGKSFVYPIPKSGEGCSHTLGVGWWFLEYPICFQALATGQLQQTEGESEAAIPTGMDWTSWKGKDLSLQSMSFLIRPIST